MSIPRKEGVYLLKSYDCEYTIYKVGRSHNLSSRLAQYPPNFNILITIMVDNSFEVEKKLLGAFRSKYESYGGNEYFLSKLHDFHAIELFNNITHLYQQNNGVKTQKILDDPNPFENHKTDRDDPCLETTII